MTVRPTHTFRAESRHDQAIAVHHPEHAAVMGAVREDIRETLRTAWIDPAIEAAAADPRFFTAAWSAVRPNVGKSFLALARRVRSEAAEAARAWCPGGIRDRLATALSTEELARLEESARAAHIAAPKAQIVVHAFARAARRDRIPGTARE